MKKLTIILTVFIIILTINSCSDKSKCSEDFNNDLSVINNMYNTNQLTQAEYDSKSASIYRNYTKCLNKN